MARCGGKYAGTVRVAHPGHGLADAHPVLIGDDRRQAVGVCQLQHRDVTGGAVAEDRGAVLGTRRQRHLDGGRPLDDVVIRQHRAVRVEHHARSGGLTARPGGVDDDHPGALGRGPPSGQQLGDRDAAAQPSTHHGRQRHLNQQPCAPQHRDRAHYSLAAD